ncbi:MAG: hypothetical protein IJ642_05950 [Oscillospiraceae bacterium]|nr:hypothetical protein [Oscillospiraceae bacterium]
MNIVLIFLYVDLLLCLGTSCILFRKRHIAEILAIGTAWFFCSYIFSTMILFLLNVYTLERGIKITCLTDAIFFLTSVLTCEKVPLEKIKAGFSPEKELRVFVVPLLIALIGMPFVSQKNELFGMGQDEGVYQCEAINFIYGHDSRQQNFEEYQLLTSDESRENFQIAVHNKLVGYDIPSEDYPDTVYDREVSPVSGIYHGIPTYPAILALWGKIAGIEHMADIQTIFYILMIFFICFICDNLKLKPVSRLMAAILSALSPVVIWVAKSSLTEMFLAVLIAMFLYFLTGQEHPEHYGFSLIPIAVFSCYHVSIYTLLPYVLIIYAGMYFFTRKSIFAASMLFSVLGYLLSYLMMRHVQPFYTMNNYRFVFNKYISLTNITETVLIISGVLILFCMIYILLVWKLKKTVSLEVFLTRHENLVLMQWLLICLTALPLIYMLYKAFSKLNSIETISSLTIAGFTENAGLFLLPAGVLILFFNPKRFLESESTLVIYISFFYCVLIYSAFLRFQTEYYYYYARYLVPFIPAAVIFSVSALDKMDKKFLLTVSLASLCFSLPYSGFLMNHKDDTRMEWSVLEDTAELIPEKSCVVIQTETLPTLWLPIRAITGAAVYPSEKDTAAQFRTLSEQYEEIYFISTENYTYHLDDNLEVLYRNVVHCSEDMNLGKNTGLPMQFAETSENLYIYQYLKYQTLYTAEDIAKSKLYGIDEYDKDFCWTIKSSSALRCTLKKKPCTLTLALGSNLPLKEMGRERFTIRLSVNGAMADLKVLTRQNNPRTLVFEIPEEFLTDGSNIIGFQTDMWQASAVNPKDTRTIGIPVKSLTFQERS